MILGFKKHFADKTETLLAEKILSGEKIHSLREGDRWEEGNSIQMAYGVRTKNYNQFNANRVDLQNCKSTQEVFMTCNYDLEITVDDKYLLPIQIDLLIKNDGLTRSQFINWFFKNSDCWKGQIIHWTDFKY